MKIWNKDPSISVRFWPKNLKISKTKTTQTLDIRKLNLSISITIPKTSQVHIDLFHIMRLRKIYRFRFINQKSHSRCLRILPSIWSTRIVRRLNLEMTPTNLPKLLALNHKVRFVLSFSRMRLRCV